MKKRGKKLLSLLLCGAMLCLYLPLQAQAVQFSDVSANAWYYTTPHFIPVGQGDPFRHRRREIFPYRNADPWPICHHACKIHPVG